MFIAVDLKVVEGLAAAVGRSGGMSEDAVLAGLVRLWHRCWADEIDVLSGDEIAGVFAFEASVPNGAARAVGALVAFGFLEALPDSTWRVKGASRYLKLKESRRRGAKAANAARAQKRRSRASHKDALERDSATHNDALTPSHRVTESPNTESPKDRTQKKPRAEKPPDPRHAPLVATLCATFEKQTGAKYPFSGIDAAAVSALLAKGLEPTIVSAWTRALQSNAYPVVRSLSELVRHFPHFVGSAPTGPPTKGASWTQTPAGDDRGFLEGLES